MKVNYFHKWYFIILLTICSNSQEIIAQIDTLYVDNGFVNQDLETFVNLFSTDRKVSHETAYINSLSSTKEVNKYVFFGLKNDYCYLSFTVLNRSNNKQNLILEISNTLMNNLSLYEKSVDGFNILNKTGTDFTFSTRLKNDRKFLYPITLNKNENKTYLFQIIKPKSSLIIPGKIWSEPPFQQHNKRQYLIIGLYFGLCLISILISLYTYTILRNNMYLIYALYVISLGLYLFSFLGLFFQYFISENEAYNKYTHVFFTVSSLVLFVMFSQKVLNSIKHAQKIRRLLNTILVVIIIIRFSDFVLPSNIFIRVKPLIMRLWYLSFIIVNIGLVLLILKSYKHQKKVTLFYTIAFSFMCLGSIITIVNLSSGYIDAQIMGLPIVFYASFLEIIFLTFTIVFMVKEIYEERNELSIKLANQQKKFLTAFLKGEEKERDRIGKELHDNIGSKLSYLKRFVDEKFKSPEVNSTVDDLCNDVRNLSHEISPSEIKLVGLVNALTDLAQTHSSGTNIEVVFNSYHPPKFIDENISHNLFRIVQEALNNVIKHASARRVDIQLIGYDNNITIAIEDNGKGFNLNLKNKGFGIKNMSSRVHQLNGEITIDSRINSGTSILITVPI